MHLRPDSIHSRIIEAAPSAMIMVDKDGHIVLANAECERLFGWGRHELLGQSIEKLLPARFRENHPEHRQNFVRAPQPRTMGAGRELHALRKDGREVPVEVGLAPIETEEGLFVLSTVVDLTERRQAERRFRVTVESSPIAMAMVDGNGVIVLVNTELERLFGYTRSELYGQAVEVLVPERSRERHPDYRAAFGRDPQPRAMGAGRDLYGRRKDAQEVPVEVGLAPIETEDGLFVLVSVVDITERQRAEDRFRRAVESAPNAMLMVDGQGNIVLSNSRAEEMFGYEPGALLQQPVEVLVPARFRDRHSELRARLVAERGSRRHATRADLFGLRRSGAEFPVEIGLDPIDAPDGPFTLASVIDVSERKQAEEARALAGLQLERINAELEGAKQGLEATVAQLARRNEELDEFAYAVSHDLRSPLRAIDNLARWIHEDAGEQLDGEPRQWLQEISRRVGHMDHLLQDMLRYSRTIRAASSMEEADFGSLIERIVTLIDIPPGFHVIPRGGFPAVRTHRVPLEQVLRNLVDNAIKHHDREDGTIEVLGRLLEGDRIELVVRDDGPGIPAELRDRAFALFRSLSEKGGSGIGLTMVKRLVEARGGSVQIREAAPRGTEICVEWPLADATHSDSP